jgi:hypothetical protein
VRRTAVARKPRSSLAATGSTCGWSDAPVVPVGRDSSQLDTRTDGTNIAPGRPGAGEGRRTTIFEAWPRRWLRRVADVAPGARARWRATGRMWVFTAPTAHCAACHRILTSPTPPQPPHSMPRHPGTRSGSYVAVTSRPRERTAAVHDDVGDAVCACRLRGINKQLAQHTLLKVNTYPRLTCLGLSGRQASTLAEFPASARRWWCSRSSNAWPHQSRRAGRQRAQKAERLPRPPPALQRQCHGHPGFQPAPRQTGWATR